MKEIGSIQERWHPPVRCMEVLNGSCPSNLCPEATHLGFSPYVSGTFEVLFLFWSLGWVPVSESLCGHFKGILDFPVSLRVMESLLIFTARSVGLTSQHWSSGHENFVWGHDLLFLRGHLCSWDIPYNSWPLHMGVGPTHWESAPLLSILTWFLLYILSYITFVQLFFKWL